MALVLTRGCFNHIYGFNQSMVLTDCGSQFTLQSRRGGNELCCCYKAQTANMLEGKDEENQPQQQWQPGSSSTLVNLRCRSLSSWVTYKLNKGVDGRISKRRCNSAQVILSILFW